jgi:glycosyltransferase involved in cell wall biosynthesis
MPGPVSDLVSVVIPTRNRCDRLIEALASVKRQTWPHLQIIVVDDASSDRTQHVLRPMAAADSALRVIRNEVPLGGAGARNQGIMAAEGRWIAFLDDDDAWLPTKLEKQLHVMKTNASASAVSCDYFYKGPFRPRRLMRAPRALTEQQMLRGNCLGGASVCFTSTDTLNAVGGFDPTLRSGQDWDLWLRLFAVGPILVCDEPLALYDSHLEHRITNDISSVYSGRRRIYFRYRRRMTAETRHTNVAFLLYCKAFAADIPLKYRLNSLRRILSLVGFRESLKYMKWFVSARIFSSVR